MFGYKIWRGGKLVEEVKIDLVAVKDLRESEEPSEK